MIKNHSAVPRLTGPVVLGWKPNTPLTHRLSCTGERPIQFTADGLPAGLQCETCTGIVIGVPQDSGTFTVTVTAQNAAGSDTCEWKLVIGDALALTPPMGWNTWNVFGGDIHEDLIKEMADALIDQGLADAGYQYVNLDD